MASMRASSLVRDALPKGVLFEEQDGLYWLRGKDLQRAKKVLGLGCSGAMMGLDERSAALYAQQLLTKGIKVGLKRGNTVRAVSYQKPTKPCEVPSTTVGVAPELIFGTRELDRLGVVLTRKHSAYRELSR